MHYRIAPSWLGGLFVLALLIVPSMAPAALPGSGLSLHGEFNFSPDELSWGSLRGYDTVILPGSVPSGIPGFPELPGRAAYFLIPEGYRVAEVRIDRVDRQVASGKRRIVPVRGPNWEADGIWESPDAYGRADEYPGSVVELSSTGSWRGERVAEVIYHPLGWRAQSGDVILYPHVSYSLVLAPETPGTMAPVKPLRQSAEARRATRQLFAQNIVNAADELEDDSSLPIGIASYTPFRPTEFPSLDGSLVEYVIITTDALAATWQAWADWKTQKGVPAVVRTTSSIDASYHGTSDLAVKIRMFIRDAYQKWGTQYVLLGGDTNVLPPRYAHTTYYNPGGGGEDIPTDLYYGALDGTWDGDGDGIYGEGFVFPSTAGDSVDLFTEVAVGRAPVSTSVEVNTFIAKSKNYRLNPAVVGPPTAAFVSQVLFPVPWPTGPDSTIFLNGCDISSDAIEHIRAPWDTVHICEYPLHPDGPMNFNAVRNTLNAGYGVVSIITHGDAFKLDTSDGQYFHVADMEALTNNNKFSVYFYSNCNTSQYDSDCINEAALFNATGGCVAAIGPSRLEFPQNSRGYMEEFYRLLFNAETDCLGELNDAHKIPFIGLTGQDNATRWVHMAGNLLGDPELRMWRSVVDSMVVTHSGTMGIGDSLYTVTVTKSGSPVSRVLVTMWNGTTKDYARGLTNASGQIVLHYRPSATGTVQLGAAHPLYKTRSLTVNVTTSGQARLAVNDIIYDDDGAGLSSGNGDGVPDAGERIELGVKVKNVGSSSVSSVNGSLSLATGSNATLNIVQNGSAQPGRVFIGQAGAHPGSLPAVIGLGGGGISPFGRPYFTAAAVADTGAYFWSDLAGCHVRFEGGRRSMTFTGSISTDGEVLSSSPVHLEATDTMTPSASAVNFSVAMDSMDWEDGFDIVLADSGYMSILVGAQSYGTIAAGDTATRYFLVEAAPEAPDRYQSRFGVTVTGTAGSLKTWNEGLRVELEAPVLEEQYHAIDDSTDGGNKDGLIQTGETVRLNSFVRNVGHGKATGVQGTLLAVSGVTVLDSLVTYGDIAAGAMVSGATRFRLTGTGLPKVVTLEIRDSYGRLWSKTINLGVPDAPGMPVARLVIPQVARAIDLLWTLPAAGDILGYNVYRAPSGSTTFTRQNAAVIDQSAFYHDLAVSNESTYVYKVAAVDSAGNEGPRSGAVTATAPPPYLGTFPKTLAGEIWSSFMCMDLGEDATGDLEIIVGSHDGFLYVFNPDGSPRAGWPKKLGGEIWASAAVGNLDADTQNEIVVGCNNNKVYAFNFNGSGLTSGDGTFATLANEVRSTPTLADLDHNGTLEVIVGCSDGKLYAFKGNGTPYLATSTFANPGGTITASPTVCDLDGNGDLEVIVPNLQGSVYAYNHDGTPYNTPTGLFYTSTSGFWSSLAVGDADGNGQQDVFGANWGGQVFRWGPTGTVQAGWPKAPGGEFWGTPALGDLNNDGKLECVIGGSDRKMHAYQFNGTEAGGWPFTAPDSIWSSAALADISGDGRPDVIFTSMDSRLYALKHDGTAVPGWPLLMTDRNFGSGPAVADVDRDGGVDVVAGGYEGRVYVWDIGKPWNPSRTASPWPTFCHDAYRTGWYNQPYTDVAESGGGVALAPERTMLAQNEPNPFNPRTVIRYDLAVEGEVTLSIYDVAGRRVKSLVTGTQPAGRYRVVWNGDDDHGHASASGVYFYRLETKSDTFNRKMIMVR